LGNFGAKCSFDAAYRLEKLGKEGKMKEVEQLISMEGEKGFLSFDENEIPPNDIVSSDQIDDVLMMFDEMDIDVVDPAYAPGTSTPEPFGLTPRDVLEIIEAFSPQLIGCDIAEICPPYDHGQTAVLAAKLIQTSIRGIYRNIEA
jgi:hypothetical protein